MAKITRKYNRRRLTLRNAKYVKPLNKSRRVKYTSKRSRSRKGGYDMNAREGLQYLREYKKEAPYLEKDYELEIYEPELDIDDNEPPAYILSGKNPPPRPSRFTGKVDTSDITGIPKKSWNPFSRFTRKNKIQRTQPQKIKIEKKSQEFDTDSLSDSDEYVPDDGSLEDIYEEVRADQPSSLPVETKPSFFSRLFGKKSESGAYAPAEPVTEKKPWYKFWGGLRRTRKLRRIRKSRKPRNQRRNKTHK